MKKRLSLLARGLFPETLPPCFTSEDAPRAFLGIVGLLDGKKFHKRPTEYIRYNGTKHDRNRRYFGTPNIVSYFHVSGFIHRHWSDFSTRYNSSAYSLSAPEIMPDDADRAIKVASLSELSSKASKNLKYAPVVLKADISQFFSSIYTHSIAWSKHGQKDCKSDFDEKSSNIYFNELDFHVRNCQSAQTRGLLIGPDAFRLIAEFISCGIDQTLNETTGANIIGAVRHVDDYYIGVQSEADAAVVLSRLREILAQYELQLNDTKTKIISSLEPINDLWAQNIRRTIDQTHPFIFAKDKIEYLLDSAFEQARILGSDSPVKMALRGLDSKKIYRHDAVWELIEAYLQRCTYYHPHAIDYVCLLVVKRNALGRMLDYEGWKSVAERLIRSNLPHRNHHEIVWLLWMMLACEIEVGDDLVQDVAKLEDGHISALLVQAFADGRIDRKPSVRFSNKLSTTDNRWLLNLVSRRSEVARAAFGGSLAQEFEHLAKRRVNLINLQGSIESFQSEESTAISRTRYGYDDSDDDDWGDDEDY